MSFFDQLWKTLCLRKLNSIYVLLFFIQEQIIELLFLENRSQDSRRRSFWCQWDIAWRAMAKHCSLKCIYVLAVYDNFFLVIQ